MTQAWALPGCVPLPWPLVAEPGGMQATVPLPQGLQQVPDVVQALQTMTLLAFAIQGYCRAYSRLLLIGLRFQGFRPRLLLYDET